MQIIKKKEKKKKKKESIFVKNFESLFANQTNEEIDRALSEWSKL